MDAEYQNSFPTESAPVIPNICSAASYWFNVLHKEDKGRALPRLVL